jgi:hypothetical protein
MGRRPVVLPGLSSSGVQAEAVTWASLPGWQVLDNELGVGLRGWPTDECEACPCAKSVHRHPSDRLTARAAMSCTLCNTEPKDEEYAAWIVQAALSGEIATCGTLKRIDGSAPSRTIRRWECGHLATWSSGGVYYLTYYCDGCVRDRMNTFSPQHLPTRLVLEKVGSIASARREVSRILERLGRIERKRKPGGATRKRLRDAAGPRRRGRPGGGKFCAGGAGSGSRVRP